ncbi:NAD(P)-dependent oxidoreductase [Clavibacter nebraskensis]
MRIAVTGGSGKLGRHVVADLRAHGHEVTNIDQVGERGSGYVRVDTTDYGQVVDALFGVQDLHEGFDAIVHLAAIPAPAILSDVATFHNNMLTSFNVFQAARRAGITKVVYASSETVLGLPFDVPPPYIPVDEEYPAQPNSTYSLVKHLEEQMAIELCRWDPELQVTALRFSNVMDVDDYEGFPGFDDDALARKWNL